MKQRFIAHYVDQEEFLEYLRTKKPKDRNYYPYLKIETIENYDADSFRCYFWVKINNAFENTSKIKWRPIVESDLRTNIFLLDYIEKRKECYITYDGVSFYKVLDVRIEESHLIEIHLRRVSNLTYVEHNRAFMIMPFGDKGLNSFYKKEIKEYLKGKMQIDVLRADDFSDNDVIIDTIYREIQKAEFIICEISEANKNVFYEIGYAKALNKELIFLLRRGIEHKFFDVAHIRRIDYDIDEPIELQEKLKDTIQTIRGRR